MKTARIHGSSIAIRCLRILSNYAYLSENSDFFRGTSQIAPEEIVQFFGRKKKFFGRIK